MADEILNIFFGKSVMEESQILKEIKEFIQPT